MVQLLDSLFLVIGDKKCYYSFLAGLSACGGSVFGKLSSSEIWNFTYNWYIAYTISAIFIILMLVCNAAVLTLFVKALQESSSSFVPTLIVAATNYLLSAFMGVVLFGEALTLMWCLGTALILSGLALIASDTKEQNKEKQK